MGRLLQPESEIRQVAPFVSGAVEAGGKPVHGQAGEHLQGLGLVHLCPLVLQKEEKQEGGIQEVYRLVLLLYKRGGLKGKAMDEARYDEEKGGGAEGSMKGTFHLLQNGSIQSDAEGDDKKEERSDEELLKIQRADCRRPRHAVYAKVNQKSQWDSKEERGEVEEGMVGDSHQGEEGKGDGGEDQERLVVGGEGRCGIQLQDVNRCLEHVLCPPKVFLLHQLPCLFHLVQTLA